ncbi:MAG: FAD-dependent oxidoreductase [Bacilli bacterium]|nr:FAD-dependent oxidoreductase [Bacilli bacterium]
MLDFKETTRTYTKEEAFEEARRCLNCKKPFCKINGCPAHLRNNEWIHEIVNGNIDEAYKIIMDGSNLSTMCCRVCDHYSQCIGNCVLNKAKKEPVKVGYLERFVQDNKTIELEPVKEFKDINVAVIGSGPSGLSCALELVKNGIHATVYEKEEVLGGVLSLGIPEYRLPKHLVKEHIEFMKRMGVTFKTNETYSIDELKEMGYKKVFVGCGLSKYRSLGIPGENLSNVYDGGSFLRKVNLKQGYNIGDGIKLEGTTFIVGAGNVAMDCCRTSQRVGSSKSVIVYRRSLEEAPATKEELNDASKEGVIFNFLYNPVEIIGKDNKVCGIKCEKMILGEPDESGRRKPIGSNTFETFECDNVIIAIGEQPDGDYTNSLNIETNHGYIVSSDGFSTSDPFVYAGGDIVRGADTVVRAMYDGKCAALKMIEDFNK